MKSKDEDGRLKSHCTLQDFLPLCIHDLLSRVEELTLLLDAQLEIYENGIILFKR